MAKHVEREYRVIVAPCLWAADDEHKQQRYEQTMAEIKRHVDGVHAAYLDVAVTETCSRCGAEWQEEGPQWCCTKAQEEWKAEVAQHEK